MKLQLDVVGRVRGNEIGFPSCVEVEGVGHGEAGDRQFGELEDRSFPFVLANEDVNEKHKRDENNTGNYEPYRTTAQHDITTLLKLVFFSSL